MKRLLIAVLLAVCVFGSLPSSSRSAHAQSGISIDSRSSSGVDQTGSVSSLAWSHTVGAAATGTALGVCVAAGRSSGFGVAVTSVTCDGASLNMAQYAGSGGSLSASIWYLVGVAPGCHQITVTFALPLYTSTAKAYAVSLSGVNQTSPLDAGAVAAGAGGDCSLCGSPGATFTTINDGAFAIDISEDSCAGGDLSPGGGQTAIYDQTGVVSDADGSFLGPISPPGATTTGWSAVNGSARWVYAVQAFAPAP
jgi:hypothetical protein